MLTRAITGFFFILVMLGAVLTGAYTFSAFFVLLSLLCTDEFYRMVKNDVASPNRWWGLFLGCFLFSAGAATVLGYIRPVYMLAGIPLMALIFVMELYKKARQPFVSIAFTFLGLAYAALPFAFFFLLGFLTGPYTYVVPLGFLLMLWSNDTGAYLAGRAFGKHALFQRHSPKKTWEGFFGGLLLSLAAAGILAHFFNGIAVWQWIGCAAIISVFGTFGDLTESMLKRSLNVKDSGSLLPGHGGLLDRFDGLLLAAPLVFVFLKLTS